jgi:hypothetical protein
MAFRAYSAVPLALTGLFLFMGMPLLMDEVFGLPRYWNYPGFEVASRDNYTVIIYCLFMWIAPILIWFFGQKRDQSSVRSILYDQDLENIKYIRRLRPLFILFMISPLLLLPLAPDPTQYFDWFPFFNPTATDAEKSFHTLLTFSCMLSIQGVGGWLLSVRKIRVRTILFVLPFTIMMPWLQFKRSAVAIVMILIGYVIWRRGILRGYRFFIAVTLCVALVIYFSFFYLQAVRGRGFKQLSREQIYEDFRIDFGRDDEIKLAIFAEVYPEYLRILECRGQALLYYASLPIPRSLWPEKPLKYPHYLTSAALGLPADYLSYGLTTSIFGQFIADFSWAGLILGPLFVAMLCRLTYRSQSSIGEILGGMVVFLVLLVHLSVVIPWMVLWFLMVLKPLRRRRILYFIPS